MPESRTVPGFSLTTGDRRTPALLLPTKLVHERERERELALQEEERQEDTRRATLRAEQERRVQDAAKVKAKTRGAPSNEAVQRQLSCIPDGSYRVLVNYERAVLDEDLGVTADSDVRDRLKRIRHKLFELGPDREIAGSKAWRKSLSLAHESHPHLRGPIETIQKAYALADASNAPPMVPPLLLLGAPGVGKSHFAQRIGALLGIKSTTLQMSQPSAGCDLLGTDAHWSTSRAGLLFNTLCLGTLANPMVILDELDKATPAGTRVDATAQLHAVLERETSRRLRDVSVDVEFDGSLVTYVATANDHRSIPASILSRFDVHVVAKPSGPAAFDLASSIVCQALESHRMADYIRFDRKAVAVLAYMAPRQIQRYAEQALGRALLDERRVISEQDLMRELGDVDHSLH